MQLFFRQSQKPFFETISGWVWGPIMLVLLVGTGIFADRFAERLAVHYVGLCAETGVCAVKEA